MGSKSPTLSRRELLAAGVALPIVVARPGAVLAKETLADPKPPQKILPVAPAPDYTFRIANQSIAPLGKPVDATLVNGVLPGPEIRYREGDLFRVVLENGLKPSTAPEGSTTVHWHGLIVPNWMDGVPEVTQLPIGSNESFYVEFPLVQTGTYWYHSHSGLQEQLGLSGPLIVEERSPAYAYDHDVTCLANDWLNQSPYGIVPQIRGEQPKTEAVEAPSGDLYNLPGAKSPFEVDVNYPGFLLNGASNDQPWTFQCRAGDRLRLRMINAATSSTFRIALDDHEMTVIACDGNPCEPFVVDSLAIAVAERYDVLVTIKRSGAFTLHWCALGQSSQVVGVIHAGGGEAKPNLGRPDFGKRIGGMGFYDTIKAPGNSQWPAGPPNEIDIELGGVMAKYLWSLQGRYYPEPYVPKEMVNFQPMRIESGQRVRLRLVNKTKMWHPMHLHGHSFRVLARNGEWSQPDAPIKDTVGVGPFEEVDIEFYADNPGRWFFHCRNLYHFAAGMASVFQYGANPAVSLSEGR